jgi:undecaprenyl-diphosphatase
MTQWKGVSLTDERVSALETRIFRAINDLPESVMPAVWLPMQAGSFGSVPVAAVAALVFRGRRPAAAIATAGVAAYLLAKGAKHLSGRPRPVDILDDVRVRGRRQAGGGFPSGHAAVSAALVAASFSGLKAGGRVTGVFLAVIVPFGRVYVGAHLPLDGVGGSALGLAVGSLVRRLIVPTPRPN